MRKTAIATIMGGVLLGVLACLAGPASAGEFPSETNYDTTVHPDEALVDLRVRNSRWPDCYSLETIIRDVLRIEGVDKEPDASPEKAMALWTWLHMLKSTGGSRVFEGAAYGRRRKFTGNKKTDQIEVRRGDKQLLVYGVHECGGMGRTMAHLWRAAGFLGYQEASRGHSTAALRYPDKDNIWRMHSFNPQGHSYYWNPRDNRVGTRRVPVMSAMEYRRLVPPMTHTLRTGLRIGEVVVRKWKNDGYIQKTKLMLRWAGKVGDNKRHFRANVAGQEDQTLTAATDPKSFAPSLWKGSANTACSPPRKGRAVLHPKEAGKLSSFIYRLTSPYVAVEAIVEADLVKTAAEDVCRLSFSTDMGETWTAFYEKKDAEESKPLKIELGQKRYWDKQSSITSYYTFLVKAEFKTAGEVSQVGMNSLKVTVHRQLNMRCLPNLMPKENVVKISAASMKPGLALRFKLDYEVNGKARSVTRTVAKFPHYFRVDIDGLPKDKLKTDYYLDKLGGSRNFNLPEHPLRMHAMRFELVPLASAKLDKSMPAEEAKPFFKKVYRCPHVSNRRMIKKEKIPKFESQVSGFFPQLPRPKEFPTNSPEYYAWLRDHLGTTDAKLPKMDAGVTDAVGWCIKKFPKAHSLHTVGFCGVFAQFKDKRAIPVLLAKWEKAPRSGPGDRYIPDALVAIGDPSVVPALIRKVKGLRIDYRVHVVRALGIFGGEEAEKTLKFLAEKDPNISVRGQAKRMLELLVKKKGK